LLTSVSIIGVTIRGVTVKYTCIFTAHWEGSPMKHSPWAAMHLAQWCCHCWQHFWNSCCGMAFSVIITFFWCLQYPEIFILLRQTLFLEITRSHLEQNEGNRIGVPLKN
jgi:hypothetical protein